MQKYLFFLITSLTCLVSHAQPAEVDSLVKLLELHDNNPDRVRILNQIAATSLGSDPQLSLKYSEEALALSMDLNDLAGIAESHFHQSQGHQTLGQNEEAIMSAQQGISFSQQIGNTELLADLHYLLGRIYYDIGQLRESKSHYQLCQEVSENLKYKEGEGKAFKGLGDLAENNGNYDEALEYFKLYLSISLENGNTMGQMVSYNDLGRIYEATGNTDEALKNYLETLRIAENVENARAAGVASGNIGSLHFIQKNYTKAKEYSFKCLENYKKAGYKRGEAHAYQDIAQVLKGQGLFDEAMEYYQKALVMRTELGDKRGLSFTYYGMGNLYERQKDWRNARINHEKSLLLREELGFKMGMSSSLNALGKLSMEAKEYREALRYLKKAFDLAEEIGGIEEIIAANTALSRYYEETGDFKNALIFQKSLLIFRDSLFNEDQNKQFAEMQTLYESEKQEKQILQQTNDILQLETVNAKITTQRNNIVGGVLTIGLLGFFGFQWNKIRKERNDKIAFAEALIYAQEEERKRIARDLHDGVGQSLLLIKKQMEKTSAVTRDNQKLISNTLDEVRSISQDLHPFQLEKFGLTSAIVEAIGKVEKSTNLFVTHEIENVDKKLSSKAEINVYRAIQEALSNIVKHANATAIKVNVNSGIDGLIIRVQDNGKGFDHELATTTSKSLGLRTMHERISNLGGKLIIRKGEPKGTTIEMEVPVSGD